jgi:ATP-dependent protease HslVU (ClpYQ) peptidase subunit
MKIAAEICIYTNNHVTMEEIEVAADKAKETKKRKGKE